MKSAENAPARREAAGSIEWFTDAEGLEIGINVSFRARAEMIWQLASKPSYSGLKLGVGGRIRYVAIASSFGDGDVCVVP
jgi:hypothetical protein